MCKYEWSFYASCRHTVKTPAFCYYHQTDIVPIGAPSSTYEPPALKCHKWRKHERPCLVVERRPKPKEGLCPNCSFKMWAEEHFERLMQFLRENGLRVEGIESQSQHENENENQDQHEIDNQNQVETKESEDDVREAERMAFLDTMNNMDVQQEQEKMEQEDVAEA